MTKNIEKYSYKYGVNRKTENIDSLKYKTAKKGFSDLVVFACARTENKAGLFLHLQLFSHFFQCTCCKYGLNANCWLHKMYFYFKWRHLIDRHFILRWDGHGKDVLFVCGWQQRQKTGLQAKPGSKMRERPITRRALGQARELSLVYFKFK